MMSKPEKMRELQELLDELFTPAVPKKFDNIKRGGPRK